MNLLLDQGLPRGAAPLLRSAGIDTIHVGEVGLSTAEDVEILRQGLQDNRAIVTLDADFHALLALSGTAEPSVIRIRIEGLKAEAVADLLQTVLNPCAEELQRGAMVTVQEGRLRIRHLPLTSAGESGKGS